MRALDATEYKLNVDLSKCQESRPLLTGADGDQVSSMISVTAGKVSGLIVAQDRSGKVGLRALDVFEQPKKDKEGDSRARYIMQNFLQNDYLLLLLLI